MRSHPNLTPARREWIEAEAPTKESPTGWAAENITKGWPVPEQYERASAAASARETAIATQTAFRALPTDEQEAILAKVVGRNPTFKDKPLTAPGVTGSVANVMAEARTSTPPKESP